MLVGVVFSLIMLAVICDAIGRQPDDFYVTRVLVMNASADRIFNQINNLHHWQAWSPWARLDHNATHTYAGSDEGIGASLAWNGNSKVGVGTMTIIESVPEDHIKLRLDFEKPMKATHHAVLSLVPQNNAMMLTWSMTGYNNFLGKAISLIMDYDKMIGGQFEQGLRNLQLIVESPVV